MHRIQPLRDAEVPENDPLVGLTCGLIAVMTVR
jgi:hypothetical protein